MVKEYTAYRGDDLIVSGSFEYLRRLVMQRIITALHVKQFR